MFDVEDFDVKVIKSWNRAISNYENWKAKGPRWTFIEADMRMACNPQTQKQKDQFFRMFNDLADLFEQQYKGLSFVEYTAKTNQIHKEYQELFGIS
jgi:hypothetical protein